MEKQGWKTLAIVLLIVFILTITIFVSLYIIGYKDLERETKCAYEVCEGEYPYYYFDNYCQCYRYDEHGLPEVFRNRLLN